MKANKWGCANMNEMHIISIKCKANKIHMRWTRNIFNLIGTVKTYSFANIWSSPRKYVRIFLNRLTKVSAVSWGLRPILIRPCADLAPWRTCASCCACTIRPCDDLAPWRTCASCCAYTTPGQLGSGPPSVSESGFQIRIWIRIHWPDWIQIQYGSETLLIRPCDDLALWRTCASCCACTTPGQLGSGPPSGSHRNIQRSASLLLLRRLGH